MREGSQGGVLPGCLGSAMALFVSLHRGIVNGPAMTGKSGAGDGVSAAHEK